MITKTEKETVVQFGEGTIQIMKAGNKGQDAFIGLKTQEKKPIGSNTPHDLEGKDLSLGEPEIILAFKNPESMDVFVDELAVVRTHVWGEKPNDCAYPYCNREKKEKTISLYNPFNVVFTVNKNQDKIDLFLHDIPKSVVKTERQLGTEYEILNIKIEQLIKLYEFLKSL